MVCMAHKFYLSTATFALLCGLSMPSFAEIYQCKDDDEMHIRLQDTECDEGFEQVVIAKPLFSDAPPSSMLREQELADLDQFNQNWLMRKYFDYDRRNAVTYENTQYRNARSLEILRHEQAKEMFDKNYRHFYMYGVSNGGGSFPLSYAPNGDVQNFTQSNTQTNNQGQNAGDVVNQPGGVINGGVQQVGNQNN